MGQSYHAPVRPHAPRAMADVRQGLTLPAPDATASPGTRPRNTRESALGPGPATGVTMATTIESVSGSISSSAASSRISTASASATSRASTSSASTRITPQPRRPGAPRRRRRSTALRPAISWCTCTGSWSRCRLEAWPRTPCFVGKSPRQGECAKVPGSIVTVEPR